MALGFALPRGAPATTLDLTTADAFGTINDAWFFQVDEAPAGSGVIDSFVRIEDATPDGEFVDGVNTSARPLYNDELNGGSPFTTDLLLSEVGFATYNDILYREFFLDFNEAGSEGEELLSLDRIKIYLTDTAFTDGDDTTFDDGDPGDNGPFLASDLIYDLDFGGDSWIQLNYALDSGSGEANMRMLIPDSLFTDGTYVYLYSAFGEQGGIWTNSDGFEEWYVGKGEAPPIPEPATVLLLGSGLIGLVIYGRRRKD
jgi:hypothetical protein